MSAWCPRFLHPYFTTKDMFGLIPQYLLAPENSDVANPLSTPPHIVPEWYLLPYYAILRAIPNKLLGVIAMFASIGLLVLVPWLDTSRVRSARFRPIYRKCFWLLVVAWLVLAYCGAKPPEGAYVITARIAAAHFLILMPLIGGR